MACKCQTRREEGGVKGHQIRASSKLRPNEIKRDTYEGRQVIRVPVVMARSDVVMNGSLVPTEELIPETWDGVPVTWGHPADEEGFVSANTPETLSEWSIGRVFNSRIDGTALKGEAWIEVERARKVAPGFVETLLTTKGELPIDVSTGYFSRDEKTTGQLNGRSYEMINRDLKPNHLAILVGEEGACSWEDGCGLRSNSKRKKMTKLVKLNRKDQAALDHVKALIKGGRVDKTDTMLTLFVNERGNDDDRRQIMADLISREESPYTPEDEQSLAAMSDTTLRRMRDDYLSGKKKYNEDDPAEGDEPVDPKEGEEPTDNQDEDEIKMKDNAAALPKTMGELTGVITKVVSAALKSNSSPAVNAKDLAKELAPLIITDEMKAAMSFVTNQVKQKRDNLIAHIVANSAITKAAAEAMNDATLEVVAAGILPRPSYAGASFSVHEVDDENDPEVAAMTEHLNIRDELAEARKAKRSGRAA